MTSTKQLIMTLFMIVFSTPLWAAGVAEDFNTGPGGFLEDDAFSVSNGRYLFRGNRTDGTLTAPWMGGANPGGWNPSPNNSNYFKDFNVSTEVIWEGGEKAVGYGLAVCLKKNQFDRADFVGFYIHQGAYIIMSEIAGQFKKQIEWTPTSLILPGQANELSLFKIGNYFSFSINDTEVQELTIDGCAGGAIGLDASKSVDVAFDNFIVLPFTIENFNSDAGGFSGAEFFSVSNEQLLFQGDGTEGTGSVAWGGGANPGGWSPNPSHSNYFENLGVSVDALWLGGDGDGGYGISVCNQKNSMGTADYVLFLIDGQDDTGYYISTVFNGQHEKRVEWTASSLIKPGESNRLSIMKMDNRFVFSINGTEVQELTLENCGGSVNLEASKAVDVSFDDFRIIDMPSSSGSSTGSGSSPSPSTPSTANQAPSAYFTVTPPSGNAPLTVSLDASTSRDPDGQITRYSWTASDSQTASGQTATMTFGEAGNYTIRLIVTDNQGATGESVQQVSVTKAATTQPPPAQGDLYIAFQNLKDFYKVGEVIRVDLVQKVNTTRHDRVDLWVAIQLPNGSLLYRTELGIAPFSAQPQPFKKSLDNLDTTDRLVPDFEVPPGMGGDYIFYAAFVKEGINPVKNGLAIKSIIDHKTTLAN
ncbi:MAG: PKD domain-containing protein [Candidatus Parabeggiatoa sp.]|nr:PKD domain-containing protein [Candidatus Parabeggiatoa sp.]